MTGKKQACDPTFNIVDNEQKHAFLSFCSFVCIAYNKKLNFANIFIHILKDESLRKLYMKLCGFDSEFETIKSFLEYGSPLYKSKYIKKFLSMNRISL
jgi:hypothetical protein